MDQPVQQVQETPKPTKPKRIVSEETRAKMRDNAINGDWRKHCDKFQAEHPELKGRELKKEASKTYVKKADRVKAETGTTA